MNATDSGICRLILSPTIPIKNSAFDITCDGRVLGVADGELVELYDVFTLEKIATYNCSSNVRKITFSNDNQYFACLLCDHDSVEVCVYDVNESKMLMRNKVYDFSDIKYATIMWSPKSTFLLFTWNSNLQTDIISTNCWTATPLSGTKLDSLNRPLCSFSPDENYYIAVQRTLPSCLIVYSTAGFIELKKYVFDNLKDISGVSWFQNSLYFCLWDSPLQFNLQVWSVYGKQQMQSSADLFEYGVRSVCHSPCGRLLAVKQFKKTEIVIYDTITCRKVAILNHCERIARNKIVTLDKAQATKFHKSNVINWHSFDHQFCKKCKTSRIQKSSHESTLDLYRQCYMHFSFCGNYIATYEPTYSSCVWIWSIYEHELLQLVINIKCENTVSVADVKWHMSKPYLAVDIGTDALIWNHETKSAFIVDSSEKTSLETVWCNSTNLLISIATSDKLSLAFSDLEY